MLSSPTATNKVISDLRVTWSLYPSCWCWIRDGIFVSSVFFHMWGRRVVRLNRDIEVVSVSRLLHVDGDDDHLSCPAPLLVFFSEAMTRSSVGGHRRALA